MNKKEQQAIINFTASILGRFVENALLNKDQEFLRNLESLQHELRLCKERLTPRRIIDDEVPDDEL